MTAIVVGSVLIVLGVVLMLAVRPASGVATALAGGVVALVGHGAVVRRVDEPVLERVLAVRSPTWTAAAEALSLFGGTVGTGGLAVVVAGALAWRGRRRTAVVWVAAVAVGASTIRGVKVVLDRPRPPVVARLAEETTESLPSGHALMAALGLGLAAAGVGLLGGGAWRRVAAAVAVVLAAGIGASRVYLGAHWVTDVVTGWLLGGALVAIAVTVATRREPAADDAREAFDHHQ